MKTQENFSSIYLDHPSSHRLGVLLGNGEGIYADENWNDSLTRAALDLHDGINRFDEFQNPLEDTCIPPDVIFATATNAVPFAFALKEFWKCAYPLEATPIFKIMDISLKRFGNSPKSQTASESIEWLRQEGERMGRFSNIAVFDEMRASGATLKRAGNYLRKAGYSNINFMHGEWGYYPFPEERPIDRIPMKLTDKGGYLHDTHRLFINGSKWARVLVKDMKTVGRLMADEARNRERI